MSALKHVPNLRISGSHASVENEGESHSPLPSVVTKPRKIIFYTPPLAEHLVFVLFSSRCRASVAQRQSVGLGIKRSRVRNSLVPSSFSLN